MMPEEKEILEKVKLSGIDLLNIFADALLAAEKIGIEKKSPQISVEAFFGTLVSALAKAMGRDASFAERLVRLVEEVAQAKIKESKLSKIPH